MANKALEKKERFDLALQNEFPNKVTFEGVTLVLVCSKYGYGDYDVEGHPQGINRIKVVPGIKRGEMFNVYSGQSTKHGLKWLGSFEASLHNSCISDIPVGKKVLCIEDLGVGVTAHLTSQFTKKPILVRSLGNYGSENGKVYLTRAESKETPESMANKFQRNILPDCFVCWHFEIGTTYQITLADKRNS